MLYALEQGPTEKAIFERSVRYKMPLPESLKNAPSLFLGLEFYYNAFRRLSTCRQSSMGISGIDYFTCVRYCDEHDIYDQDREDFITIITGMDETFVEYCNKQAEKKQKKQKPEPEPEKDQDG